MDGKRIQCLLNALQHEPSILNRFPEIQPVSSKVIHYSTFFAHFDLLLVRPWDNPGNVTWMERGFNAGQTHIPIYLQPFTSYSEILVWNCNFFLLPLHLTPKLGCSHWNFWKKFGPQKTRIMELPGSEDSLIISWAISTQYQRVTDGQTDRRPAYMNNVHSNTDAR